MTTMLPSSCRSWILWVAVLVLLQGKVATSFNTGTVRPWNARTQPAAISRVPPSQGRDTHKYKLLPINAQAAVSTRRYAVPPLSLVGAAASLPLWTKLLATCALPPCLGFYKQEYGVSYAYGTSVSLGALWIYLHFLPSMKAASGTTAVAQLVSWHAGALIFYGVRLCCFLALRQNISKRIQEGMERIESRAKEKGSRLKRAPFLIFCAGLYYGLVAPLLLTAQLSPAGTPQWCMTALQGLIATAWFGFVLGAAGDANKTLIKGMRNNENHLVTGGIFRWVRHPNYTGEIIGWTANALSAVVAAIAVGTAAKKTLPMTRIVSYALSSVFAAVGLDFVLLQATQGLEKRQKETYGDTEEYKTWIQKSWVGFVFPESTADVVEEVVEGHVKPELEVSDVEEDEGTGI